MTPLELTKKRYDEAIPFKRYFLLIANNIVKLAVQLAVLLLYARMLSIHEYGIYQTVWLFVNVISVFALFGLPNLILTYGRGVIFNWIACNKRLVAVHLVLLHLISGICFFLNDFLYSWQNIILIYFLIILQCLATIAETLSIKQDRDIRVVIVNIISALLFLSAHVLVLYFGYSLPLLLIQLLFIQLFKLILLSPRGVSAERVPSLRGLGRQWMYLGLVDSLSVLYKWLDKWIILFFISVSQFAIYLNGSYEIPIFLLMVSAVGNVLLVELSKTPFPTKDKIKSLFTNTTLLLAAFVFPSFAFLFFYHEPFFLLIFGEQYRNALPIFVISIFIIPLRIINYTALLQAYGRNDLVLRGVLIDLSAAILIMLVLYPWQGVAGIAVAFVASTYLQSGFYLWHTVKLTRIPLGEFFPLKKLSTNFLLSFIVSGLMYIFIEYFLKDYLLISGLIICLIICLSILRWLRKDVFWPVAKSFSLFGQVQASQKRKP